MCVSKSLGEEKEGKGYLNLISRSVATDSKYKRLFH